MKTPNEIYKHLNGDITMEAFVVGRCPDLLKSLKEDDRVILSRGILKLLEAVPKDSPALKFWEEGDLNESTSL